MLTLHEIMFLLLKQTKTFHKIVVDTLTLMQLLIKLWVLWQLCLYICSKFQLSK